MSSTVGEREGGNRGSECGHWRGGLYAALRAYAPAMRGAEQLSAEFHAQALQMLPPSLPPSLPLSLPLSLSCSLHPPTVTLSPSLALALVCAPLNPTDNLPFYALFPVSSSSPP
eukprot:3544902-Rhodomonas_salina.1